MKQGVHSHNDISNNDNNDNNNNNDNGNDNDNKNTDKKYMCLIKSKSFNFLQPDVHPSAYAITGNCMYSH